MSDRVVVASDGTPESHDAVVLGAALARGLGGGLSLVGVYHPEPILIPMLLREHRRTAKRYTEGYLRRERKLYAPEATIEALWAESAPYAIRRYAERWPAGIVVIGSRPKARTGHAAIGRRGRQLLAGGKFALAIAARGLHRQSHGLRQIAVGFDDGAESHVALDLAARLTKQGDAELTLVGVVDPSPPALAIPKLLPDRIEWEQALATAVERLRERAQQAAAERGAHARVEVTVGDPGYELRRFSSQVDLLVVGSRRWGTLARLFAGAVGETLVADAGCSVLVVPRPTRAQPSGRSDPGVSAGEPAVGRERAGRPPRTSQPLLGR